MPLFGHFGRFNKRSLLVVTACTATAEPPAVNEVDDTDHGGSHQDLSQKTQGIADEKGTKSHRGEYHKGKDE